ncbi:Uncharacterized protein dnm_030990 [Desulfonema magnum]|uniref:Uncharacterized protein n=1 Tax=Desulfonema magnum TaxID=45655 RepID=A0A975GMT9_9BACT|nr:Uncharacterized protein dnm_030990 [Desulfonema magnum]
MRRKRVNIKYEETYGYLNPGTKGQLKTVPAVYCRIQISLLCSKEGGCIYKVAQCSFERKVRFYEKIQKTGR